MGLGHGPELAAEGGLLFGRQGLVAEEDDVVRVERVANGGHHVRRQRTRNVHAGDLRADGGGERVDSD